MNTEPRVQYVGILVSLEGKVTDVMLYPDKQQCIDNLVDAVGDINPDEVEAKVWEHTDLPNGDQNCQEVWDLAHPDPSEET